MGESTKIIIFAIVFVFVAALGLPFLIVLTGKITEMWMARIL